MTFNPQTQPGLVPPASETTLVGQLQARDEKALGLLYDKYSAALYGVALKIVKHQELAEDVLQETFIRIWASFAQYDAAKGRLFTWMLNICRNLAIDKIRSRGYREGLKTQDIQQTNTIALKSSQQTQPDHIGIKEVTEKLNPEQKLIIDMLYFEGYTQSEVAEALNIPLGTVKTRARNAIRTLYKFLKEER